MTPRRTYITFMDAYWSITERELHRLQADIARLGYVPSVEDYGGRVFGSGCTTGAAGGLGLAGGVEPAPLAGLPPPFTGPPRAGPSAVGLGVRRVVSVGRFGAVAITLSACRDAACPAGWAD